MSNVMNYINGANYGSTFIPETFFNPDFFTDNNIAKTADDYSLCDLHGPDASKIMTNWLDERIVESDFQQAQEIGVNFFRVPMGYWNVIDIGENPTTTTNNKKIPTIPASEQVRLNQLNQIMPAANYKPYIDKIFGYAEKYGIQILLDFHGLPGSQNGADHSGCSFKYDGVKHNYWDNDWNIQASINAIEKFADICVEKGDTCYGIEMMNEPGDPHGGLSRWHLRNYYQKAILAARGRGLPADKPMIVMEWANRFQSFWGGNWQKFFPTAKYGTTQVDVHMYDFQDSVAAGEADMAKNKFPLHAEINKEVPVMVGEWTLSEVGLNNNNMNGYATWIYQQMHDIGLLGGVHWLWRVSDLRAHWSMIGMSTLHTPAPGGVNWRQVFQYPDAVASTTASLAQTKTESHPRVPVSTTWGF